MEDRYVALDTSEVRVGGNSSVSLLEVLQFGTGFSYEYWMSPTIETKGDLVVGNIIKVVLGTLREDTTRKEVVAFWNSQPAFTHGLKTCLGLWLRTDSLGTTPAKGVELRPLEEIVAINIPNRIYNRWDMPLDTLLVLRGFDANSGVVNDTAYVDTNGVVKTIYVPAIGLTAEYQE